MRKLLIPLLLLPLSALAEQPSICVVDTESDKSNAILFKEDVAIITYFKKVIECPITNRKTYGNNTSGNLNFTCKLSKTKHSEHKFYWDDKRTNEIVSALFKNDLLRSVSESDCK